MSTSDADLREQRFRGLLAEHGAAIFRLVRFRERDADLRKDLEQEIALALWRSLDSFRGEASERAWVLRVALNVAATHATRSKQRKDRERDAAAAPRPSTASRTPEAEAVDRARLDALEARIRALDVVAQQVVLLHLEGLSTQEIADVTGLTATNVTTKLSRIRAALVASETEEA